MKHENLESLRFVKLLAFSMIDLTIDVNKTRTKTQVPHHPHITLQVKKKTKTFAPRFQLLIIQKKPVMTDLEVQI